MEEVEFEGTPSNRFDAMQCNAMQCNAMRCDAMQCNCKAKAGIEGEGKKGNCAAEACASLLPPKRAFKRAEQRTQIHPAAAEYRYVFAFFSSTFSCVLSQKCARFLRFFLSLSFLLLRFASPSKRMCFVTKKSVLHYYSSFFGTAILWSPNL
jgi:hypothetical protein